MSRNRERKPSLRCDRDGRAFLWRTAFERELLVSIGVIVKLSLNCPISLSWMVGVLEIVQCCDRHEIAFDMTRKIRAGEDELTDCSYHSTCMVVVHCLAESGDQLSPEPRNANFSVFQNIRSFYDFVPSAIRLLTRWRQLNATFTSFTDFCVMNFS